MTQEIKKGRPFLNDDQTRQARKNVSIDNKTVNYLKEKGDGNLSNGIRTAVNELKKIEGINN